MITVPEFYTGKSVFVTGFSGYIGKTVVEKLLRKCSGIHKIYLLLRAKKNRTPEERLQALLDNQLFDTVKAECPTFMEKLHLVFGDITETRLGLNDDDYSLLVTNINVVIHVAASINFNEPLRVAMNTNVFAVRDMINLCKNCVQLQAFVHCSTGFVRSDVPKLEEKFYEFGTDYRRIIDIIESVNDETLEEMKPQLLGDMPNTYVYTKLMAECLLANKAKDLPLVIVRPTLVSSMWREDPIRGWSDTYAHIHGLIMVIGKGYLRALSVGNDKLCDLIPVDIVSNALIVGAWKAATNKGDGIPIYNSSSSDVKRLTWGRIRDISTEYLRHHPYKDPIRKPLLYCTTSAWLYKFLILLYHTLPAHLFDYVGRIQGKKTKFVRTMNNIHSMASVLAYFGCREWSWSTTELHKLHNELSHSDARVFPVVPTGIIWESYIAEVAEGMRIHILNEHFDDVPASRRKVARLHIIIRFFQLLGLILICGLIYWFSQSTGFHRTVWTLLK